VLAVALYWEGDAKTHGVCDWSDYVVLVYALGAILEGKAASSCDCLRPFCLQ